MLARNKFAENATLIIHSVVLGSGKTSLILKCLPKLPRDYKVVLLKNEFGDVQGTDWSQIHEDRTFKSYIQWIASSQDRAICLPLARF